MQLGQLVYQDDITLTESDFRQVSDIIYKHCGINLHEGKKPLVRARLAKRLREGKFKSFSEYIKYALSDKGADEFYNLVDSLSTNLTSFFREKAHLDYLKDKFLTRLIAEKGTRRRIRGWSAGCSSGEEPYTIAIVVSEALQNQSHWDVRILASDVSTRMIEIAKTGTYDPERVEPLTVAQKQRFLVPNRIENRKVYQVSPRLQQMICFRYLNLMHDWPFKGPFDFIFCRNVMIYFDKPTQERLVNRFYHCLAPGGLLCIGHSESLTSIDHKYKYVMPATYCKT